MSKLVLFDGNAIMHRAYHALPSSMATRENEPINAVYGLVSMLLRVIQDLEPTHIAFAFDRPEPTFRKKLLPDYQGHREEMDEDLGNQFPKAYETMEAFGIPVYDKKGFEADDVIGTIAEAAKADEVVVVTGDRDMLQLVSKKTKLYMPEGGLKNGKLYGKAETVEKMGVPPEQIIDYKGLVGDPSDNYKGVPGVGPKTAEKLLKQYGSFENIYKNIDELDEKISKKLIEHKDSADMSYKLARIVTDVNVDFDLGKSEGWKVDSDAVLALFEKYGFRTLTKRVQEVGKQIVAKDQLSLL